MPYDFANVVLRSLQEQDNYNLAKEKYAQELARFQAQQAAEAQRTAIMQQNADTSRMNAVNDANQHNLTLQQRMDAAKEKKSEYFDQHFLPETGLNEQARSYTEDKHWIQGKQLAAMGFDSADPNQRYYPKGAYDKNYQAAEAQARDENVKSNKSIAFSQAQQRIDALKQEKLAAHYKNIGGLDAEYQGISAIADANLSKRVQDEKNRTTKTVDHNVSPETETKWRQEEYDKLKSGWRTKRDNLFKPLFQSVGISDSGINVIRNKAGYKKDDDAKTKATKFTATLEDMHNQGKLETTEYDILKQWISLQGK